MKTQEQLEYRLSVLEQEVSFVAQMLVLGKKGHAVASEHKRLNEIAHRYGRFERDEQRL
jgi:16S rRNA G1207 methylase RsmC